MKTMRSNNPSNKLSLMPGDRVRATKPPAMAGMEGTITSNRESFYLYAASGKYPVLFDVAVDSGDPDPVIIMPVHALKKIESDRKRPVSRKTALTIDEAVSFLHEHAPEHLAPVEFVPEEGDF